MLHFICFKINIKSFEPDTTLISSVLFDLLCFLISFYAGKVKENWPFLYA